MGRSVAELLNGEPDRTITIRSPRPFRSDRLIEVTVPGRPGISSMELAEWMAFEQTDGPPIEVRADYHAAQLVQAMVALHGTKKGKKPPKIHEFVLDWDAGRPKRSGLQLLAMAAAANRAAGGIDVRAGTIVTGDGKLWKEGDDD